MNHSARPAPNLRAHRLASRPSRPEALSFAPVRIVAALLALVAVVLMIVAIAGMVTGRPGARVGVAIRVAALLCFAGAVALNVITH